MTTRETYVRPIVISESSEIGMIHCNQNGNRRNV